MIADIANRILSDAFKEPHGYKKTVVSFCAPLTVFIFSVIGVIVYDTEMIHVCCNKKRNNNSNRCQSGTEWASFLIKLCTLIGGVLYFAGGNLKTVDNTKEVATLISPALSVSGVVIFRIFTHALRTLQHYCKGRQRPSGTFKLCSPNHDIETHSLEVVYVHLLTFLIEFDTVLSVVMPMVDSNNMSDTFCTRTDQRALVWTLCGGMIGIFWITQFIIIGIFCTSAFCPRKNCPCTVKPAKCNKGRCCWSFVLSILVAAAVPCNLFAEILQCFMPQRPINTTARIVLSSAALVACFVVSIAYLSRKACGCVQVKGKLEAVDVHVRQIDVQARYKLQYTCCGLCTYKHTSTYTHTNTAPYAYNPNQYKELYKDDIEGIVNFVRGPVKIHTCRCTTDPCTCPPLSENDHRQIMTCLQSTTSISKSVVKVRKDLNKIEKVHMFGDQAYLVVRTADDPTINVYKVRELKQGEKLSGWTPDEGEPIEIQHKTNIHTYRQKRNGKEYMIAVQDPVMPTRGTITQATAGGQSSQGSTSKIRVIGKGTCCSPRIKRPRQSSSSSEET